MLGKNSGKEYIFKDGFRYGSVAFYGEDTAGTWKLKVVDVSEKDIGTLTKLKFEVFGH
jgi:subtilisin-like proprotein convertase family protein